MAFSFLGVCLSPFAQFYYMAVFHGCPINVKTDYGSDFMPSMMPRRPRIHVEALKFIIINNTQNMRVATDKQFGFCINELLPDVWCVMSGISPNMNHKNVDLFTRKLQNFGKLASDIPTIYVAIHASKRLEGFQL